MVLFDLDVAVNATKAAHQFIVISGDVNHARSLARFAQDFLDHIIVLLRPINSATQRPDVDQVRHDVQSSEIILAQKIRQRRRVPTARTQVRVGDPCGAIPSRCEQVLRWFAKRESLLSCKRSR